MLKDWYMLLFFIFNIDLLFVYFWHFDRTFWIAYCKQQNYFKQKLTVAWTIQLESKSTTQSFDKSYLWYILLQFHLWEGSTVYSHISVSTNT